MNFSIIFPGQNTYNKKKLKQLYKIKLIKNIFEEASETINYNIWKNINKIPIKKIKNRYLQPIIITISISIYKLWAKYINIQPNIIAGHSLGEYSSLICANAISFNTCLKLVKSRGKLMESISKKRKISTKIIFGIEEKKILKICKKCSSKKIVEVASVNSKKIIVISGDKTSVDKAEKLCKKYGSKKNFIVPISVPVHSSIAKSIKKKYLYFLKKIHFKNPKYKIINNVDAKKIYKKKNITKYLCKQLYKKVKWKSCIDYIIKKNIKLFLEMSTKQIFIKKYFKNIKIITINSKKKILYAKKKIEN
ncbi:acyltransferase domain-containing protein [Buchnera aphidicola]|uniref:acyltransferase domain-containing protein n=1 Tax=Buchnera aphidicola TaxID=9 RepID=UPI0031B807F1